MSGRPIGVVIRSSSLRSCPCSLVRARLNRAHFALEPISPMLPRSSARSAASQIARSSAWSWVITSTWVPGGRSAIAHSGVSGSCRTCTSAMASASTASRSSVSCSVRESTSVRSTSCRARMRASSRPTCPTPKIATAPVTGIGSSSTVTSPPQHCTPNCNGALSDNDTCTSSGVVPPVRSISRAASMATASRLPPPTVSQTWSNPTTIFAPACRGECPRTCATVTSTPGERLRRRCASAVIHCIGSLAALLRVPAASGDGGLQRESFDHRAVGAVLVVGLLADPARGALVCFLCFLAPVVVRVVLAINPVADHTDDGARQGHDPLTGNEAHHSAVLLPGRHVLGVTFVQGGAGALHRPVDLLRSGRGGELQAETLRPEGRCRLPERLPHRDRQRQRRFTDRLRSVHRTVLGGVGEHRDVQLGRHLGEARQLVRAGCLGGQPAPALGLGGVPAQDRKSTRLNSSHVAISY